jgi:2-polyprenyl-3-methyl-5-hydroxy-6-metoxy-1,4-benzoquinol methylase
MNEIYDYFKKYISGSIVDVGCDDGKWLKFLKSKEHFDVYGIDKDNKRIIELRDQGIRCECMILENIHIFISRQFDTVCCLDILGKFTNQHGLLRNLQWLSVKGGSVLIKTDSEKVIEHALSLPTQTFELIDSKDDMYVLRRSKEE